MHSNAIKSYIYIGNMGFSLKIELNHKLTADGRQAILIRLTKDRRYSRMRTSYSVFKASFNTKAAFGKWIRSNEPRHAKINAELLELHNKLFDFCSNELKEKDISGNELLKKI